MQNYCAVRAATEVLLIGSLVVACAEPEQGALAASSLGLVGVQEFTVSLVEAEPDEAGALEVRTELPFGPAPQQGEETLIEPELYALCGVASVGGYFDRWSHARIVVNGRGFYEAQVRQAPTAREAGMPAPVLRVRCIPLSGFDGLPPSSTATSRHFQEVHLNDQPDKLPRELHEELEGSDYSASFMESERAACVWHGLAGSFSFPWTGAPYQVAEVGAYEDTSDACGHAYGEPHCGWPYRGKIAARVPRDGHFLISYASCLEFSDEGFHWTEHPSANQTQLQDSTAIAATPAEDFCVLAGIFGGGAAGEGPAGFLVGLDPMDLGGTGTVYGLSASHDLNHGPVGAWSECFPGAQ